jgi:uncharacterized oligopeptide transporter (OPT) family protein
MKAIAVGAFNPATTSVTMSAGSFRAWALARDVASQKQATRAEKRRLFVIHVPPFARNILVA